MKLKVGQIVWVRTNSKGYVKAEILKVRDTTVSVRFVDGTVITRKIARDIKEIEKK